MSYRLAAALPGVLAAIAPVSGAVIDLDVREGFPRSRVSLVAFHGRQDTVFDSMDEGVAAWRRHVGCQPPLLAAHGTSGTVTRAIAPCRNGTDVVVYELADMGHAWPGGTSGGRLAAPDAPSRRPSCCRSSSSATRGGVEAVMVLGTAKRRRHTRV
jgi:polyhydroxybutyrate depolymerase